MASRSIHDLSDPVRALCNQLIAKCAEAGIQLLVYRTLVSNEEQAALYKKGRGVLTNAKAGQSEHNPDTNGQAWAFDAVPLLQGAAQWQDVETFTKIGLLAESIGLKWSGRWTGKFREFGHFYLERKQFLEGHKMNDSFANRVNEPSTWAGLAVIFTLAGAFFPQYKWLTDAIAGVLAGGAVVKKEGDSAA